MVPTLHRPAGAGNADARRRHGPKAGPDSPHPLPDAEFAALLVGNLRLLWWLARRHAEVYDPAADVEEVVQSAALVAWTRRRRYDPAAPTRTGKPAFGLFLKWAFRAVVADRRAKLARREERGFRVEPLPESGDLLPSRTPAPDAAAADAELRAAVRVEVGRLDPARRAVVEGRLDRVKFADLAKPGQSPQSAQFRYADAVDEIAGRIRPRFVSL